jgi:hypothetical protein
MRRNTQTSYSSSAMPSTPMIPLAILVMIGMLEPSFLIICVMESKFVHIGREKRESRVKLTIYNHMKDSAENYYQSMSQFQVKLLADASNSKVWTNRLRENLFNNLFHSILAIITQKLVSSIGFLWYNKGKQFNTKGNLEDFYAFRLFLFIFNSFPLFSSFFYLIKTLVSHYSSIPATHANVLST